MRLPLFLSFLLGSALHSQAMIGESREQCVARYGPVRAEPKPGEPTLFVKAGFALMIVFERGRAVSLSYQRLTTDAPNHSKPITDDAIQLLLETNAPKAKWCRDKPSNKGRVWTTTDGKLVGFYDDASNVFSIQSKK